MIEVISETKDMKQLTIITLLLFCATNFGSCIKEEVESAESEGAQLTLSIPEPDSVITYSTASVSECRISDAYVLIFDGSTGTYKAGEQVELSKISENGTLAPRITTQLPFNSGDLIVVLANTGHTYDAASIPLTVGVSTRGDINAAFPSGDVLDGLNRKWDTDLSGNRIPMCGEVTANVVFGNMNCTMYRAMAKINVVLAETLQDVTGIFADANIGFTIYNRAKYGNIYSQAGVMSIPAGMQFGSTVDSFIKVPVAGTASPAQSYYTPEWNNSVNAKLTTVTKEEFHADRTCVIMQVDINKNPADRVYYRLDIARGNGHGETKEFLDILRNHHYIITITKVGWQGYSTIENALKAPGSNLEYTITDDVDGNNIISNGQYAIATDRSSVEVISNMGTVKDFIKLGIRGENIPSDFTCTIHLVQRTGTASYVNVATSFIQLVQSDGTTAIDDNKLELALTPNTDYQLKYTSGTVTDVDNIYLKVNFGNIEHYFPLVLTTPII